MYRYSFDNREGAQFRITQERYEIERDALKLLLTKVEEWNETALKHGAAAEPYAREADDLRVMISYIERRLNEGISRFSFGEKISVGNLRYIKAGLLYSIRIQETELDRKSSEWPTSVVESVRARIQPLRNRADDIEYDPSDLLSELRLDHIETDAAEGDWDVFICHASEDKDAFVRPFAQALREARLRVWYDEFTLSLGDSLLRSIDRGLARSRYGIVVLSPSFFVKDWPQRELDGLVSREVNGRKVIIPLWHDIDAAGVVNYSPTLAGRLAASTSQPMDQLIAAVLSVVRPQGGTTN